MIRNIVVIVLEVYLWGVLFPRALLSWFPASNNGPLATVNTVLWRLSEPILAPIRRLVPPMRFGGAGIDLSFLIVFFGLQFVVIPVIRSI